LGGLGSGEPGLIKPDGFGVAVGVAEAKAGATGEALGEGVVGEQEMSEQVFELKGGEGGPARSRGRGRAWGLR
jgi:hypothetical protein